MNMKKKLKTEPNDKLESLKLTKDKQGTCKILTKTQKKI